MFRIRLKELREKKGMNQRELAAALHVSPGTIGMWESGAREPQKIEMLQGIANYFHVSTDYLLGNVNDPLFYLDNDRIKREINSYSEEEENESTIETLAQKYRLLDSYGKEAVDGILDVEWRRCGNTQPEIEEPPEPSRKVKLPKAKKNGGMVEIKVYDEPAAAGLGNYLDEPDYHMEQYPEHIIPYGTDFGIRIDGDSMEPKIHNGYTVFVKSMPRVDPGQIGIYVINGKSYCKKLAVDHEKRQTRLVSLNPKYEDIVVQEWDSFATLGQVLGQWGLGAREDDWLDW